MEQGTKENPWALKTAPGTAEYTMYHDTDKNILVCKVGSTTLHYDWRCVEDLHPMLVTHGDWIESGAGESVVKSAFLSIFNGFWSFGYVFKTILGQKWYKKYCFGQI